MNLRAIPYRQVRTPEGAPPVREHLEQLGCTCWPINQHYLGVRIPDTEFWCTSNGAVDDGGLRITIRRRTNGRADRRVRPIAIATIHQNADASCIMFLES